MEKVYSVWVGGVEINEHYLTKTEADSLAEVYKREGYTDVCIRKEV